MFTGIRRVCGVYTVCRVRVYRIQNVGSGPRIQDSGFRIVLGLDITKAGGILLKRWVPQSPGMVCHWKDESI